MPAPRRTALVWGDPPDGPPHTHRVRTSSAAARRVSDATETRTRRRSRRIVAGEREAVPVAFMATVATPWVTVLCKYHDVAAEPFSPEHVRDLMGDTYPRLGHYWREVSYGQITLAGSRVVGWLTLPGDKAEYIDAAGNPNFARLLEHATTAAADQVRFAEFSGINLVFNDGVGCCNWGARWGATIQGVEREWGVTWLPPSAMRFLHDVAHEMGHGYGLPHSRDDHWDVMSWGSCSLPSGISHPVFGCLDVHTIAWHKDKLGWIPAQRRLVQTAGGRTITLERLAQPGPAGFLMAQIPIPGTETGFYTVEARTRVGYDAALPDDAVIIHEIDTTREMPAELVKNPARVYPMWLPGETFVDAAKGISVSVRAATSSGFEVSIRAGADVPDPPSHLRLGAVTSDSVTVHWDDNSEGEAEFQVWWKPVDGGDWTIVPVPSDTTAWTHAGLVLGQRHVYYVRACNAAGCSGWTNGVEAEPVSALPAPPSDLRAVRVAARQVDLAWQDNAENEARMQVWWQRRGDDGWIIEEVGANATSWSHTSVQPAREYIYFVRACNDAGCSDWSNGVPVTTPAAGPPAAPSRLRVAEVTADSIRLTWTDNADDESRFQVWRTPSGLMDWTIEQVEADVTEYTHGGLAPGQSFSYWVQACNVYACSNFSNGVSATVPDGSSPSGEEPRPSTSIAGRPPRAGATVPPPT